MELAYTHYTSKNVDLGLHGAMTHLHARHGHGHGHVHPSNECSGEGASSETGSQQDEETGGCCRRRLAWHPALRTLAGSRQQQVRWAAALPCAVLCCRPALLPPSASLTMPPSAPPPLPAGKAQPCTVHGGSCQALLDLEPRADPSQIVGIYLMEAGIVFHSVLIGLTLGVTGGSAFATLLLALSFHQVGCAGGRGRSRGRGSWRGRQGDGAHVAQNVVTPLHTASPSSSSLVLSPLKLTCRMPPPSPPPCAVL